MPKRPYAGDRRTGFTLPEVLVAVAMVGVIAAATLPAVINQVNKSEISRVVQDLQNIGQAAQLYRTDVGLWPASTDSLIEIPHATTSGWGGPYLARTTVGNISTGAGGIITNTFGQASPAGATGDFLRIHVTDLTVADAQSIDLQIDGGDGTNWYNTGLVQSATATDTDPDLYFFPVAIK